MDIEKISRKKNEIYRLAQERIDDAGMTKKVELDRRTLGYLENEVKVYILPVERKGHRNLWAKVKTIEGFHEVNNTGSIVGKPHFFKGYIIIGIEEIL